MVPKLLVINFALPTCHVYQLELQGIFGAMAIDLLFLLLTLCNCFVLPAAYWHTQFDSHFHCVCLPVKFAAALSTRTTNTHEPRWKGAAVAVARKFAASYQLTELAELVELAKWRPVCIAIAICRIAIPIAISAAIGCSCTHYTKGQLEPKQTCNGLRKFMNPQQ